MHAEIKHYTLQNIDTIAEWLISKLDTSPYYCLEGDLGTGKTTLIETICKRLSTDSKITSPTFSLVNQYSCSRGHIFHADFYRLKSSEEALYMGYEDTLFSPDSIHFIEWYHIVEHVIPRPYHLLSLSASEPDSRVIHYQLIHE